MRITSFIITLFCLVSSVNVMARPLPCGDHYCRGGRPPGPPKYNCSENIPPKDALQDKAIYDSLNVPALALPTAYPFMGFQKSAGRLTCSFVSNSQTSEEKYSCALQIANP